MDQGPFVGFGDAESFAGGHGKLDKSLGQDILDAIQSDDMSTVNLDKTMDRESFSQFPESHAGIDPFLLLRLVHPFADLTGGIYRYDAPVIVCKYIIDMPHINDTMQSPIQPYCQDIVPDSFHSFRYQRLSHQFPRPECGTIKSFE